MITVTGAGIPELVLVTNNKRTVANRNIAGNYTSVDDVAVSSTTFHTSISKNYIWY